jgi:hypothetical protein
MDKIKENIISLLSVVILLVFISFMFIHNNETKKQKLIREDLYSDSIIMNEHKNIKSKDSEISIKQKNIEAIIKKHEKRLQKIETWLLEDQ